MNWLRSWLIRTWNYLAKEAPGEGKKILERTFRRLAQVGTSSGEHGKVNELKALITGIFGQDGSYLAELLLAKGYEVHGIVMRSELENPNRSLHNLKGVLNQITLHPASIEAYPSMFQIVQRVKPEECYHLAASSFVSYSFDDEFAIFNSNVNGTHYILSILKEIAPLCKFYFAGSSELFGRASSFPQNENTPFHPRSAYGITKATGYYLTCNYRDNYGLFGCNGIAYNHESTRRGYEFVTRKIVRGAVQIKAWTSAGARPRKSWMQNGIGDMRQITSKRCG